MQVTDVHRLAPGHRRHGALLEAVRVGERDRQALPCRGTHELVDINRMDGLIARVMATPVAQELPASGATGEEDIRRALASCAAILCHSGTHGPNTAVVGSSVSRAQAWASS